LDIVFMSPVSETCSHSVAIAVKGYEGLLNFVWFGFFVLESIICHHTSYYVM